MIRLDVGPGFFTAKPGLRPKRLTRKLQFPLNQQPDSAKTAGLEICHRQTTDVPLA